MKLSCILIDDEPLARKGLAEDLETIGLISVRAVVSDTRAAMAVLQSHPTDLIFLDIEMPGPNGLEFLAALPVRPTVILVTAYPQYALKGYEHGVLDYLVKPVSLGRLRASCEKAVEWCRSVPGRHVYLKVNGAYEKIRVADIQYIEGANNYVWVHLPGKKLLIYQSLRGMEEQLPAGEFIQVHKSFLVARRHVSQIKGATIVVGHLPIPLSRRYKSSVLQELQLTNKTRPVR
ncbi:MAG TPA: LytTR family DNA-binding domain-containing protein [Puia sp.]|nr:LytTR family DNA-binding domain-containing protein [Puia sp.]